MSLQRHLIAMLRETFPVERVGDDEFVIQPDGRDPVRLIASDASLAGYTATHAADGLLALGDVGSDSSGVTASLALLSVHIGESIEASGRTVRLLTLESAGLKADA